MIGPWLQGRAPADAASVARALDSVLGDEGLGEQQPSWWSRLFERFVDWLGDLFDVRGGDGGGTLAVVLYVLLGLLIAWLAWLVVRSVLASRSARAAARAALPPPPETLAERLARLLAEARAADAAGDHLRALRLYFWALVVGLSQKGELAYRDAWTAREMLERGNAGASVRARLAPLVREIDKKSFGGEACVAADSARLEAVCRELLGGA
ncbi:MAG: hypothetical protein IPJ19_00845 [Planctomycetes bacterium]|nr:hypothetical protein [Planctomycetota bacterium]